MVGRFHAADLTGVREWFSRVDELTAAQRKEVAAALDIGLNRAVALVDARRA